MSRRLQMWELWELVVLLNDEPAVSVSLASVVGGRKESGRTRVIHPRTRPAVRGAIETSCEEAEAEGGCRTSGGGALAPLLPRGKIDVFPASSSSLCRLPSHEKGRDDSRTCSSFEL
jgi:hypothetical protein